MCAAATSSALCTPCKPAAVSIVRVLYLQIDVPTITVECGVTLWRALCRYASYKALSTRGTKDDAQVAAAVFCPTLIADTHRLLEAQSVDCSGSLIGWHMED